MAHAGHEIADHERPMPDPVEPVMHPADLFVADVQQLAGARMQKLPPESTSDDVAARDAAHASGQGAGKRWNRMQVASIDEKAAACQQKLIGNRNADDAQHQQPEDSEIAIGGDPLEDGVFQPAMISKLSWRTLWRVLI